MSGGRLLLGLGNPLRGDDAAGLLVARAVRERGPAGWEVRELEGEPVDLVDAWEGAELALVADAAASAGEPGRVHCFDAAEGPLPPALAGASTHVLGLAEAVELARALDRLPGRLMVCGIEAESFALGADPSPAVRAAAEGLAERLLRWPESNQPEEASAACAWRSPARS
jgi:hydrogenase maturation protease